MSLDRPKPFLVPFAENGKRFDVPDNNSDTANGKANLEVGFPEITMRSVMNGGVPPWGQDHNGILHRITKGIQWTQAGGYPVFNQQLCDAIGGYSYGAILQGDNPDRPWVLWQCVQDKNKNNPIDNKINQTDIQNGWIRYPVISEVDGNITYYDDNGKILTASAAVTTEKWVDNFGNDLTNTGEEGSPFFSINQAINQSPSSGRVVIHLRAGQKHYWSGDGTLQVGNDLPDNLSLNSRKITFMPYGDSVLTQAVKYFEDTLLDGTWAYCISQINRPVIVLLWKYRGTIDPSTGQKNNTAVQICGATGTATDFSINLLGVNVEINDVTLLSDTKLSMPSSWMINGGKFSFIGTEWGLLPTCPNQYILGWAGGDVETSCEFSYRNVFQTNKEQRFFGAVRNLKVNLNDAPALDQNSLGSYTLIPSNVIDSLANNTAFNDSISIIKAPSARYKNLDINVPVSGVS
ncbi:hypothetical protein [Commensalibacter communis]|uniref:hypothetical protein n=1 Tax=Commensalibacter communis TaxID=2972786 RepID=UPI0022FF7503|nr:hypothetical protein [Commensalibacter communis]CAI3933137.1 unnamed protein product [Commensalibacter communis]CAI3945054.1 unnamed protein product [Commensalibacter communis]